MVRFMRLPFEAALYKNITLPNNLKRVVDTDKPPTHAGGFCFRVSVVVRQFRLGDFFCAWRQ